MRRVEREQDSGPVPRHRQGRPRLSSDKLGTHNPGSAGPMTGWESGFTAEQKMRD